MVRLGIELGFHHDPTTQFSPLTNQPIFTEEESQLRIRLWAIILIHDRGTSILLGRPLAISPSDSNTPHPSRPKNVRFAEFSEHFELSLPVADFQADIVNSLYAPTRQAGDTIMRNATRIIKSMVEFRRRMPERYKYYFDGTDDWPVEKRTKLVQDISEDEGLTLLKIGIARILMLRALFSSKELSYPQKHKALVDGMDYLYLLQIYLFTSFLSYHSSTQCYHRTQPTYSFPRYRFLYVSNPSPHLCDGNPVRTYLWS